MQTVLHFLASRCHKCGTVCNRRLILDDSTALVTENCRQYNTFWPRGAKSAVLSAKMKLRQGREARGNRLGATGRGKHNNLYKIYTQTLMEKSPGILGKSTRTSAGRGKLQTVQHFLASRWQKCNTVCNRRLILDDSTALFPENCKQYITFWPRGGKSVVLSATGG